MLRQFVRPRGPPKFHPHCLIRAISTASAIQRGIGRKPKNVHLNKSKEGLVTPRKRKEPRYVPFGGPLIGKEKGEKPLFSLKSSLRDDDTRPRLSSKRSTKRLARDPQPPDFSARFHDQRPIARHGQPNREERSRNTTSSNVFRRPEGSAPTPRQRLSSGRDTMPISVPHTTAASEFLYGRSAVEAALRAGRRKLYKLYVFEPEMDSADPRLLGTKEPLLQLAQSAGVKVERLDTDRLLQKISGGRPTNGLVLEASPLPFLKCTSLKAVNPQSNAFKINRMVQSREELEINGTQTTVQYDAKGKRYPFLLFLDGILDPGNLGAILRSAFFLGADAVVLSSHGSPVTATALKAASGAAEMLPILLTRATGQFFRQSQSNGWKVFAATPFEEGPGLASKPTYTLETLGYPPIKHPSMVVLGSEGSGLWEDVKQQADYFISINGPRSGQAGVDSLNVSVSAALLTQAFMRTSPYRTSRNRLWKDAT